MGSYSDEIKMNVEQAVTLLQAAKEHLENGNYEAAASRASESAFHTARALLLDEEIEPAKHGDVSTLIQEVFVNGRRLTKEQGANLNWLFAMGNAKQGTSGRATPEDAPRALEIAESFLEAAKVILEG
jgi:uncharacterized protein (UPF0332 family)